MKGLTILLLIAAAFFSGCGVSEEKKLMAKEAEVLINEINNKYFNMLAQGHQKLTIEAQSSIVESATAQINDDILRGQLERSKTFIYWDRSNGFGIRITDVPQLPSPEHDKRMKIFMMGAKDRMLGAFKTLSFIFYGIDTDSMGKVVDIAKTEQGTILTFKGVGTNDTNKYYLGKDLNLIKVEQLRNGDVVANAEYFFEQKDGKSYLNKLIGTDLLGDTRSELIIQYKQFDDEMAPYQIQANIYVKDQLTKEDILIQKYDFTNK